MCPFLSGFFFFLTIALQQDHVNAEGWAFWRREATATVADFVAAALATPISGTVMLSVYLLPKREIFCVCVHVFEKASLMHLSLYCSLISRPQPSS